MYWLQHEISVQGAITESHYPDYHLHTLREKADLYFRQILSSDSCNSIHKTIAVAIRMELYMYTSIA